MTSGLVAVRIRRRPGPLSPLMAGDQTYFTKDFAARAVACGVAEYLDKGLVGLPAVREPELQLVEPAVEVLGCPEPVREKLRDHYRKKKR